MIILIAAVAKNLAIGYKNELIYHIKSDMKRFKEITTGHTVIMGKNTFLSLRCKPLFNRRNIVLSKTLKAVDGYEVYPSLEDAISQCDKNEDIYIIGGSNVYNEAIKIADRLYLTEIDDIPDHADTFFPSYEDWEEVSREDHIETCNEHVYYKYSFVEYARKKN